MAKYIANIEDDEVKCIILNTSFNKSNNPTFEEIENNDARLVAFLESQQ